jgi:2-dehydropantoate 2-reductase
MVREPGMIEMTFFHKPNQIGCICGERGVCPHSRTIADIMTSAGLDTEAVADIKQYTWRKTILNASLSAVSAVLGMTMQEIMTCTNSFHLVEKTLEECIEVAGAVGYDYGPGFYDHCLDYLGKAGHHKPSMLVDLERGQQTEIDYINGKIDSYGFELNIPVPVNSTLTELVKAREEKHRS